MGSCINGNIQVRSNGDGRKGAACNCLGNPVVAGVGNLKLPRISPTLSRIGTCIEVTSCPGPTRRSVFETWVLHDIAGATAATTARNRK